MNEKERMLKNYLLATLVLVLLLAAVLGYNIIELKKYKTIEEGEFITIEHCQNWCNDENAVAFVADENSQDLDGIGVLVNLT